MYELVSILINATLFYKGLKIVDKYHCSKKEPNLIFRD